MANNCLVTKLKGYVDNDNIPKLGELRINVKKISDDLFTVSNSRILLKGSSDITITAKGDGFFSDTFEGLSDPSLTYKTKIITPSYSGDFFYMSNGDYDISVSDKYNLTHIFLNSNSASYPQIAGFDINDIMYLSGLKTLDISYNNNILTPFDKLKNLNLEEFEIQGNNNPGQKIKDLIHMTNIKSLFLYRTRVEGTIEEFVNGLYENGSVDGKVINCRGILQTISFGGYNNGNNIQSYLYISTINKYALTYGSSTVSTAPVLYLKGYTEQEVTEFRNQGKTVYVC